MSLYMVPVSALRRLAESALRDGRAEIDVIEDLQARGLTPREAERLVGELADVINAEGAR